MQFGYFVDPNKEYAITTPKTPLQWINYLGSHSFFSLISNNCGGYSFYKNAHFFGQAKNSRLTGTAAWIFVNVSQYILGVVPTLNGLSINPYIPEGYYSRPIWQIISCYLSKVR